MKQFIPQIMAEPFQLTKKDKCKLIVIDYFEIYIAMVESSNKMQIFALNTLLPQYYIELSISVINLTFGKKSEILAVHSEKEILIYTLGKELILQKKIEIPSLIKIEMLDSDYIALTQSTIMNSILSVDVKDPITSQIIYNESKFNLLLLRQEAIELFNNLELVQTLPLKTTPKSKLKYDSQQSKICVFEMNIISILYLIEGTLRFKHTITLNIEKIQDGCFFQLPFFKQTGIYGDSIFIYMATTKGKLGSQFQFLDQDGDTLCVGPTFQEKKCRIVIPVQKWGNNLLVLFEQGCLNRVKLYKFPQFEKLDFKFQYFPKNEVYAEQEDEFDKKIKTKNTQLNKELFTQKLFDPYYTYIKQKN